MAGLAIEKTFSPIANVYLGRWFEFEDKNGLGYCQPDVIVAMTKYVVVGECKLTETQQGRNQIEYLYKPILSYFFHREVKGVVISRHLTRETQRELVCDNMELAISKSNGVIPTLHWLGKGRI
jgi:hypothetical protein